MINYNHYHQQSNSVLQNPTNSENYQSLSSKSFSKSSVVFFNEAIIICAITSEKFISSTIVIDPTILRLFVSTGDVEVKIGVIIEREDGEKDRDREAKENHRSY